MCGSTRGSTSRRARFDVIDTPLTDVERHGNVLSADDSFALAPPLPRQGWVKLSPINRRRLDNFKRNRRGYWSFWIFLILFVASLFAEFIANDRPIVASYKGEVLLPIFFDYPEEKFGGFLAQT